MFLFNDGIFIKLWNIQTWSASISKWQAGDSFAPEQGWKNHGIYYIQGFFLCLCINLLNADNSALLLYLRSYFWDSLVTWCLRIHIPPLSYWPDFHVFILISFSAVLVFIVFPKSLSILLLGCSASFFLTKENEKETDLAITVFIQLQQHPSKGTVHITLAS